MKTQLTERQMWWRIYSHFRRERNVQPGMCILIWSAHEDAEISLKTERSMIGKINEDRSANLERTGQRSVWLFKKYDRRPRMAYCQQQIRKIDRKALEASNQ